jgi:two-component system sensor histidine kinase ChvG
MVLVVVGVLLAPGAIVLASLAAERRHEGRLLGNADFSAQEAALALGAAPDDTLDATRLDAFSRLHRVHIRLLDPAGAVLVDVDNDTSLAPAGRARRMLLGEKSDTTLQQFEEALGPLAARPEVIEARAGAAPRGCRSGPGWDFVVCYGVRVIPGRDPPTVVYAEDSSRRVVALHELGGEIGRLLLFTAPFALLLSLWMGKRIVRPIEDLRRRALARAAEASPRAAIAPRAGDETADLESAFEALLAALAEQRAANEAFLTDLVHEMKSPVATIRACADALGTSASVDDGGSAGQARLRPQAPIDEARAARLARLLLDSSRRLDTLVSQFLDLARAEAGMPDEPRTRVDLGALVRGLVQAMSEDSRFAATRFVVEEGGEGSGTAEVVGIAYRLDSVVRNLLENAASFSGEGGTVTVAVARRGDRVDLSVSDTGPGIAAPDLPRVFTRFFTTRGRERGSGLGLALARAVIEAHGGVVSVSSPPGRGATFRVDLPAARA